jgi:polysaccharide biosynthesis transport protein
MDRTYTIDELFAAVRRRWKTVAVVAGGVLVLSALVILRLPSVYTARALVMVEPFTPHPDLVAPVMDPLDLASKVKSVRESVYARSVMAPAIDELKLYPKAREKGMDEALEQFRQDTEVHAEGDSSFSITVKNQDPEVAAKAANRLAELYIEGNLQVRAGQVTRTRDIISSKLTDMQHQLSASQAKVSAFKAAHSDSLPELLEQRYHQREELTKQIELEAQFSQEAQHRIDLLGTAPSGKETEVGRLEEQRDDLHAKLAAAQSSLLADHPDVTNLQREVAANEARLAAANKRSAANDLELRRMTTAISRGEKRISQLQADESKLDKLIAARGRPAGRAAGRPGDAQGQGHAAGGQEGRSRDHRRAGDQERPLRVPRAGERSACVDAGQPQPHPVPDAGLHRGAGTWRRSGHEPGALRPFAAQRGGSWWRAVAAGPRRHSAAPWRRWDAPADADASPSRSLISFQPLL